MRITNTHSRIIHQPKEKIAALLDSLSSADDKLWPHENWPPMKFKNGLAIGAVGGHGPIEYSISEYNPGESIEFTFIKPRGFGGTHTFSINEIDGKKTEIRHIIDMRVSGSDIFTWFFAIKWLHDALLEDCLNKAENHFLQRDKITTWNIWVRLLRAALKRIK